MLYAGYFAQKEVYLYALHKHEKRWCKYMRIELRHFIFTQFIQMFCYVVYWYFFIINTWLNLVVMQNLIYKRGSATEIFLTITHISITYNEKLIIQRILWLYLHIDKQDLLLKNSLTNCLSSISFCILSLRTMPGWAMVVSFFIMAHTVYILALLGISKNIKLRY